MVTRSITFRDEVYDPLVAKSDEMHVSINWLVNQLIEEGLHRLQSKLRLTTRVDS